MKSFLKGINYSLIAFIAFTIKSTIEVPTYESAATLLVLAATYCVHCYFETKKTVITENQFRATVIKEIEDLKAKMSRQTIEHQANPFGRKR